MEFLVAVEFTDGNGTHQAGTTMDIPVETDSQRQNMEELKRYGLITDVPEKTEVKKS